MRRNLILTFLMVLVFCATYVYAEEGQEHHEHMESMKGQMQSETLSVVDVGNKICPVSGEKIGGAMGSGVQYEYKGKIYNFCCTGCVEEFKKDPEKYVKIVEAEMSGQKEGHAEHPMEMGEGDGHEGHHHMMGEMDGHMMKGMDKNMPMMKHHQESMMSGEAQVKEIDLEAFQFGFSPDPVVVNKGDVVKIHATSRDVPHGIFIKEYGVNEKVEKGKTTEIEFIADKVGEFDILCSVYCGRGHANMTAKLIVKE